MRFVFWHRANLSRLNECTYSAREVGVTCISSVGDVIYISVVQIPKIQQLTSDAKLALKLQILGLYTHYQSITYKMS